MGPKCFLISGFTGYFLGGLVLAVKGGLNDGGRLKQTKQIS